MFACVNNGKGYTELAHVRKHETVVSGVEGAFEIRIDNLYFFVVDSGIFHNHDDGRKGVVDATEEVEAALLFVEDAVDFCVFGTCISLSCPQF
jgi:hypothetical protein